VGCPLSNENFTQFINFVLIFNSNNNVDRKANKAFYHIFISYNNKQTYRWRMLLITCQFSGKVNGNGYDNRQPDGL